MTSHMKEDRELEEGPSPEEEEAEREPEFEPPYDPLLDPWNDPVASSLSEHRFIPPGARGDRSGLPAYGAHSGMPTYDRGVPQDDDLSELRRRLRQETVVVPKGKRVWSVTIRELAETLLLALLIFLAVRTSMQNFRVEGASMEPGLQNGEYLIVNKLAYTEIDLGIFDWAPFYSAGDESVKHLWAAPARGDVVVFRSPTNVQRDFIKRIIGVPGDVIEVDPSTNDVIVNGQVIDEPYVAGRTTCSASCGPWVVPERSYFVMGDNRQNSSDSRQGWFVPEENIIGKALITYWHDGSPDLGLAPNHKISIISEAAAEE